MSRPPAPPSDYPPYMPFPRPPTQYELPYSDGDDMDSWRHHLLIRLLLDSLGLFWKDRTDVFVGSNMFVYYSSEQVKTKDFRGPDLFIVTGVPAGERLSWVVWDEGKGPDVVIEVLSPTTATIDKTDKMRIYEEKLRVPEYFWYDPFSEEFAGWALVEGHYAPIAPNADSSITSRITGLRISRWRGVYEHVEATWLRLYDDQGNLLPTGGERAAAQEHQAATERARAEAERARADALEAELRRLRERLGPAANDSAEPPEPA